MLKPEMMRTFIAICETQSFTTAAEVLSLPKATVSETIKKLEETVGARLLQRTTRKVTVTQDGQIFFDRCKDLLADLEEAENLFQEHNQSISGKIRIDMPSRIASGSLFLSSESS